MRPLFALLLVGCSHVVDMGTPIADTGDAKAEGAPMKADPERVAGPSPTTEAPIAPPTAPRTATEAERARYPFVPADASIRPLVEVAAPPEGYRRVELEDGSFGAYLRGLPLRPADAEVRSYTGATLRGADDGRVFAVAELDVSPLDVQQCADSVIRWHAEWLWSRGEKKKIGYHFLSGDFATYQDYASGRRPEVKGNKVSWAQSAAASDDRKTFRRYLDMVFNYASTISLAIRTQKIDRAELEPGDFIVLPGGPGHAILILDVATNAEGKRVALLGQGFMPAQDFHVLESQEKGLSPWFSLEVEAIDTPFWPEAFPWSSLRRFQR